MRILVIGVPETFIIVYPRARVKIFHRHRSICQLAAARFGPSLASPLEIRRPHLERCAEDAFRCPF